MHGSIAKFCDLAKQHFAPPVGQSAVVPKKSANQVLAESLDFFLGLVEDRRHTAIGKLAGVAANTIKNALAPGQRARGKTGKEPSIKLTELALIASALGIEPADLLVDYSREERMRIWQMRGKAVRSGLSPWGWQLGAELDRRFPEDEREAVMYSCIGVMQFRRIERGAPPDEPPPPPEPTPPPAPSAKTLRDRRR